MYLKGRNYRSAICNSSVSYNNHSIGIYYIGGLDTNCNPTDTRTNEQKSALRNLVAKLYKEYDIIEVLGRHNVSPDLDSNDEIEPVEYIRACLCFDVRSESSNFLRNILISKNLENPSFHPY